MNWTDYFSYDQEGGNLIHRPRNEGHPLAAQKEWARRSWNTRFAGKVAGNPHWETRNGVRRRTRVEVGVNYTVLCAHRIIWEMHNGPIPDGFDIDHRDGNPHNNRLDNLRLATRGQNMRNIKLRSDSKSGRTGVNMASNGQWRAYITIGGRMKQLGRWDDIADAIKAREDAEKMHYEGFHAEATLRTSE